MYFNLITPVISIIPVISKIKTRCFVIGATRPFLIAPGILLLLAAVGCGMRKVERERQELLLTEGRSLFSDSLNLQQRSMASQYRLQQSDSSFADYTLHIWPKGQFSMDSHQGFKGEAEKILLRGRNMALLKSTLEAAVQETHQDVQQHRQEAHELQQSSMETLAVKKNPAWKWALVLLAAAIALDALYKFLQKKKATHR